MHSCGLNWTKPWPMAPQFCLPRPSLQRIESVHLRTPHAAVGQARSSRSGSAFTRLPYVEPAKPPAKCSHLPGDVEVSSDLRKASRTFCVLSSW